MSDAYSLSNLKSSSLYFLFGKVGSGLLTFIILILLARLLDSSSYGAYVTLIAMLELGFAVSNLGLGWVSLRYIPEYRLQASSKETSLLIAKILSIRTLALVVVAVTIFFLEGFLSHYLHLEQFSSAIKVYIFILVVEGLGRAIRDEIFAALLQQKIAQLILITRNIALLLLILISNEGMLDLTRFAWLEFYVSLMAFFLSLIAIIFYLYNLKRTHQPDWECPKFKQIYGTARAMYVSFLLTMASGAQVFMFFITALLGLEAAAIFGFANNLNSMLRRYLPAELLMGMIQPKLVADYTLYKDKHRLSNNALFAWKLSLAVLIPAVSFFIVCGDSFSALIGTEKFTQAGPILAGLAISLIPFSQRRILEIIANILGHPEACVIASFMSLVSLPLAVILIDQEFGLWSIVIALIIQELVFNLTLTFRMKSIGCPYGLNSAILSKLMLLIITVTFTVWFCNNLFNYEWLQMLASSQYLPQKAMNFFVSESWVQQAATIILASLMTALLGWDIGFFSRAERKGMMIFFNIKQKTKYD